MPNPDPLQESRRYLLLALTYLQHAEDSRARGPALREAAYFTTLGLAEMQTIPRKTATKSK